MLFNSKELPKHPALTRSLSHRPMRSRRPIQDVFSTRSSAYQARVRRTRPGAKHLRTCTRDPRKSEQSHAIPPEAVLTKTPKGGTSCTPPSACRTSLERQRHRARQMQSTTYVPHDTFAPNKAGWRTHGRTEKSRSRKHHRQYEHTTYSPLGTLGINYAVKEGVGRWTTELPHQH